MPACVAGVQQRQALEVFVTAQAAQRRVGRHFFLAQGLDQHGGHLGHEETGADGVDVDVVLAPFGGQCFGEPNHRRLRRVVGNGLHLGRVAVEPGDGRDVDDAARLARDHAGLGQVLAQDEVAADIEVHHLVPGSNRVVFGWGTPAGAGVVDQDVHVSHTLQGLVGQAADVFFLATVGGDPAGVDACGLQLGSGLLQVFGLA